MLLVSLPAAAQPYDAVAAGMSDGCRFAVDCCPESQWIVDGESGASVKVGRQRRVWRCERRER
ncbi:MAG TPA: hypothetical protein VF266_21305 [Thermoanaerobaculia bacterium]